MQYVTALETTKLGRGATAIKLFGAKDHKERAKGIASPAPINCPHLPFAVLLRLCSRPVSRSTADSRQQIFGPLQPQPQWQCQRSHTALQHLA
jgi:hypothetical protein